MPLEENAGDYRFLGLYSMQVLHNYKTARIVSSHVLQNQSGNIYSSLRL